MIMRHSEKITGPWKADRITFLISTQYFHIIFFVGQVQRNSYTEEETVNDRRNGVGFVTKWRVVQIYDFYSSAALVTLYYRVEQIRKCDMDSVYNRQQSV